MSVEELVRLWFELLEYCGSDKFNADIFEVKHDNLANRYKRLSYEQQGEYTHLICEQR